MPKSSPFMTEQSATRLQALGDVLRARRKALRLNATTVAEAAGLSRVTLHRIEKGEPSVTVGAWSNVVVALGMFMQIQAPEQVATTAAPADRTAWLPVRIALADYPQLRSLAWQVHGTDTLTPVEAFDIYERNVRHLDMQAMSAHERDLWRALQQAFLKNLKFLIASWASSCPWWHSVFLL